MSAASINNSGSPLLRNAIALHAAFGLTGLLIAAGFSSFGQGYAVWLFSVLMAFILVGSRLMQKRLATSIEIVSIVGFGVYSNLAQILERKSQSSCFNFAANAFSATESFKVGRF